MPTTSTTWIHLIHAGPFPLSVCLYRLLINTKTTTGEPTGPAASSAQAGWQDTSGGWIHRMLNEGLKRYYEPFMWLTLSFLLAGTLASWAILKRSTAARWKTSEIRGRDGKILRMMSSGEAMSSNGDPHDSDPGLLKKHSTFQSYTTSYATYSQVRTFYRPHPHADRLPSKPDPLPLLVFVHGLGGSLAQFKAILTSLVDVAPCLGIDFPGCGRSAFNPTDWPAYGAEALAELLKVVIEEYAIPGQGIVLVGHSLGCSVCALTASSDSYPDGEEPLDFLGLIGICPVAEPPTGRLATVLRLLLHIPSPIFNLWRMWDARDGPCGNSVSRFVGVEADMEVKKLQQRFNAQSRTPVYRRMAWGIFPHGEQAAGMAHTADWAQLKIPIYLIGGESDKVASVENLAKIAEALGRSVKARNHSTDLFVKPVHRIPRSAGATPNISLNNQSDGARGEAEKHSSELTLLESSAQTPSNGSSEQLGYTRRLAVVKTSILPAPASHGLLYDPATFRTLSGLIQTFLSSHIDSRLSLGWQLQHLCVEGKWDVKNLEKWQKVVPVSNPIGGIFRAMKTLREVDERHSPAFFAEQYRDRIKAVVDISHESPVYDPKGLEDRGIEYHKFPTVSKIPPTRSETRDFATLIDQLRAKWPGPAPSTTDTKSPDITAKTQGAIGVHCHYGFNRTGFFITSYLIEQQGYGVQQAIDEFAEKRPPGIRHPHFLDELFVRYCIGLKRAPTVVG